MAVENSGNASVLPWVTHDLVTPRVRLQFLILFVYMSLGVAISVREVLG